MPISSLSQANAVTPPGIVLLSSTSFSAASTQSVNSVFTSGYTNYRLLVNASHSVGSVDFGIRMRASGSDESTSNYYRSSFGASMAAGVYDAEGVAGTTYCYLRRFGSTVSNAWVIEVAGPQVADYTTITWQGQDAHAYAIAGTTVLKTSTSYDGFTIYPASGTMTGTVSVYGYRKAV